MNYEFIIYLETQFSNLKYMVSLIKFEIQKELPSNFVLQEFS